MNAKRKATRVSRVLLTRAGGEWSEAKFWQYIRSQLRDGTRCYPPIVRQCWDRAKRPNQSSNKRCTWEYQCAGCGNWFQRKDMQADHIVECGPLKSLDDLATFVDRLYCEPEGLQILCKENCHQAKTNKSRRGAA